MSSLATGTVSDLQCPRCGDRLSADDVNVSLMVALCRGCDATVELRPAAPERAGPPAELVKIGRPPEGLTAEERGEELVVRRRWFSLDGSFLALALFCFFWDGFLVVWYGFGIIGLLSGEAGMLIMLLFPVLHLAAGVFLTYRLVAEVVNTTTVRVGPSHLEVTHGPLPWRGPEPVPSRSIDQLYLVQNVSSKGGRTYELVARTADRTSTSLLTGLSDDAQLRWLERRIEAHLGLSDVVVDGEYSG